MKIIITCEMGADWAEEEQLQAMTDEEIREFANEDIGWLLDGSTWEFVPANKETAE